PAVEEAAAPQLVEQRVERVEVEIEREPGGGRGCGARPVAEPRRQDARVARRADRDAERQRAVAALDDLGGLVAVREAQDLAVAELERRRRREGGDQRIVDLLARDPAREAVGAELVAQPLGGAVVEREAGARGGAEP